MTPTGSWPMILPGSTGYSPRRMCTSVPQIVVIVTRTIASVAPQTGTGRSWSVMRSGPSKTAARMVSVPAEPERVTGAAVGAAVMTTLFGRCGSGYQRTPEDLQVALDGMGLAWLERRYSASSRPIR